MARGVSVMDVMSHCRSVFFLWDFQYHYCILRICARHLIQDDRVPRAGDGCPHRIITSHASFSRLFYRVSRATLAFDGTGKTYICRAACFGRWIILESTMCSILLNYMRLVSQRTVPATFYFQAAPRRQRRILACVVSRDGSTRVSYNLQTLWTQQHSNARTWKARLCDTSKRGGIDATKRPTEVSSMAK